MIVQLDNAAPASTLSQAERDEIDNRAVQEAWLSLTGTLPTSTSRVSAGVKYSIRRSSLPNS